IKDLLKNGAEVNCTNEWGFNPTMLTSQYNPCVVVLKALISEGGDLTVTEPEFKSSILHLAALGSANTKVLETLISNGVGLNKKNYLGETPLMLAVNANPETKIAIALIKAGSSINERDYQGHSALDFAQSSKRTYLIQALKKAGAN
ncbi:MAG: ankyrin repeat domain-containing protein, partial [Sphaerochaetaceae bacterium]|nr:ankyrin repeat domain-containing protein [Sphaerochaetaceae bacterium]